MERIRERLRERDADATTISMLNKYIGLAQQVGGSEHSTQLRVLQRLMRTPEADRDMSIYNDLAALEEELEGIREANAREREALEARPLPKARKFYKQQKRKK